MATATKTRRNAYFFQADDGTYTLRLRREVVPVRGGQPQWSKTDSQTVEFEGLSIADLAAMAQGITKSLADGFNEEAGEVEA